LHRSSSGPWPLVFWVLQLLPACALIWLGNRGYETASTAKLRELSALLIGAGACWTLGVLLVAAFRPGRQWLSACWKKILLGYTSAAVTLVLAGEIGLRVIATTDVDGNTSVRSRLLLPMRMPVSLVEEVNGLRERPGARNKLIYDAEVGWLPDPGFRGDLYAFDQRGVRVSASAPLTDPSEEERLPRIVLLGDSFTEGYEVPFEESWGHMLEASLAQSREPARVLNLGVQGYGMDQALLRWRRSGLALAPRLVVFGLQMENCARNVNILRPLYTLREAAYVSEPFSKPRFVEEGGRLRLLNVPCIPPAEVPATLRSIQGWALRGYEEHYAAADGAGGLGDRSLLWRFAAMVLDHWDEAVDEVPPAHLALAGAILDALEAEVRSAGATLLVVHLPIRAELQRAAIGQDGSSARWVRDLAARHRVVPMMPSLLAEARRSSLGALFLSGGHYSPLTNRLVAQALQEELARNGW
jgi:hypothetical protein